MPSKAGGRKNAVWGIEMAEYILALDQGTTSSRAILFDREGKIRSMAQKEFPQYYPQPGWVEHDPMEIWSAQLAVAIEAMAQAGATATDIAAIGITNQRETTIIWDKKTGRPIYNAIVWQCRRTAEKIEALTERESELIRSRTGLVPDPYFSASKIAWILDHVEGARERAKSGELAFGTVDSWLIYNLTRGQVHATDYTNASRTMLFNIHTMQWDQDLLSVWDIPEEMLPQVRPSGSMFGYTDPSVLGGRIPILGVCLGEQAICEAYGAVVDYAHRLMHGKQSIAALDGTSPIFAGLPEQIPVARYHSLAVRPATLPPELRVIATAEDGEVMAVEDRKKRVYGLQFHPESIMTPDGRRILQNFLNEEETS